MNLLVSGLIFAVDRLLDPVPIFGAEASAARPQLSPLTIGQMSTFLCLMVGPFKIIGPFARLTLSAERALAWRLALRSVLFSSFTLLFAAFVGESFLNRYHVALPVLALAAGVVLFLVALQAILQQYPQLPQGDGEALAPSLDMAITPLAYPTIVTPYGIAMLIDFVAMSPDLRTKLTIGLVVLGIMLLNLVVMLVARTILRFMGVLLQILAAVLGIIQVALGLQIAIYALRRL